MANWLRLTRSVAVRYYSCARCDAGSCVIPAREKSPPLLFPRDTLTAVGIGLVASGWGVLSGFNTEEFQEIVRAAEATHPAPNRPTPRGGHRSHLASLPKS